MCILFSYLAKVARSNEFKLILLSNRDEYHHRPSKPAGFVDHNIYGNLSFYVSRSALIRANRVGFEGMDLTPGKEGGTWLGISRRFHKLAVLLNLDRPDDTPDDLGKAGRGAFKRALLLTFVTLLIYPDWYCRIHGAQFPEWQSGGFWICRVLETWYRQIQSV